MDIDPILVRDIQGAESLELAAYLDTKDYWTIGWGHKLPPGSGWGVNWTRQQADDQLEKDILDAGQHAIALPEWASCDTRSRRNGLVELVFNMGCTKWQTFAKARAAWRIQRWQTASDELMDSLWSQQVGKTRSARLASYLLTGSYPQSVVESSSYASSSLAWPHGSAPEVRLLAAIGSQP